MVDILHHIHQYVPQLESGDFVPILFGGDMLTRERSDHACDAKLQSSTPLARLQGIVPKVEDWHAMTTFHQVLSKINCHHLR